MEADHGEPLARRRRSRSAKRKQFYLERYRVPASDPTFYTQVGDFMASRGLVPRELDDLVGDLERLALEASLW